MSDAKPVKGMSRPLNCDIKKIKIYGGATLCHCLIGSFVYTVLYVLHNAPGKIMYL